MLGPLRPRGDRLGPPGGGILHEVGLVDHEHREGKALLGQGPQRVERGEGDPALRHPLREHLQPLRPVHRQRAQGGAGPDLPVPVDQHARRAHHQEVALAPGREMGERGDGLHGLAEPHLVPEDHPLLRQREPRPEGLVATQGDPQPRVVEPQRPHPVRDPGGQEPLGGVPVRPAAGQLRELAVVLGGPQLEVHPRPGRRLRRPQQIHRDLPEEQRQLLLLRLRDRRPHPGHGVERPPPRLLAAEQHPQPTPGRCGGGHQGPEPFVQPPARLHRPPCVRTGLDQPVQGDDQGGRGVVGGVHVDPYGDGLAHRVRDLPGRRQRLVGGVRPDAGDQPQLVARGAVDLPDGGEPGLFEGGEAQPPLRDVLEPGDRDGGQLLVDQGGEQRVENTPYGIDGPGMVLRTAAALPSSASASASSSRTTRPVAPGGRPAPPSPSSFALAAVGK